MGLPIAETGLSLTLGFSLDSFPPIGLPVHPQYEGFCLVLFCLVLYGWLFSLGSLLFSEGKQGEITLGGEGGELKEV